jgi:thioredoxin
MEHLTKESFLEKIHDYNNNKEWVYLGKLPCVIDFYADWCGPCRMLAPLFEELAEEYKGKVNFYKVNTEEQQDISASFNIRSIPTLLFCPMEGKPQIALGALSKDALKKTIKDTLKVD